MESESRLRDKTSPSHEHLYRRLRSRVMHGEVHPGQSMTLRGIAGEFGVSMTPAREAVRRLSAEGALSLSTSGRISAPVLTNERIEELAALRALLEPELASRAIPRAHPVLIDRMEQINAALSAALEAADAVGYVRLNFEFHRTLYLRAQAPAMLALVETVWMQLGPSMRALYASDRGEEVGRSHQKVLSALTAGDEPGLRVALRADVTAGLRRLLR